MMEMFFKRICRPPDSYKANAQSSVRAQFIDMIMMFIKEKYKCTPLGSYKANTQNTVKVFFIDINAMFITER